MLRSHQCSNGGAFRPSGPGHGRSHPASRYGKVDSLLVPSDTRDVDRTPIDTRKTPSKGSTWGAEAGHISFHFRSPIGF